MSTFFQEPDFAIEPYVLAFSGAKSTGFNVGWQGDLNPNCDYTATLLQATAGSAAVVTGVVALMMQRNPFLTLRDVKHILALTARRVDENIAPQNIHVTDDSFVERIPAWTTNTAGYRFHNYYGFGLIDAAAAITMAGDVKNAGDYVPFLPPALDDPVAVEGVLEADNMIPENSASGLVEFGELSENSIGHLIVEAVQLRINISDDDTLSHYQIELRSPSGTKSVLLSGQNGGYWPVANIEDIVLMTNAFYGESAQGKWSMTIVDVKKPRYEQNDDGTWEKKSGPGALNSWGLKIYGYNAK